MVLKCSMLCKNIIWHIDRHIFLKNLPTGYRTTTLQIKDTSINTVTIIIQPDLEYVEESSLKMNEKSKQHIRTLLTKFFGMKPDAASLPEHFVSLTSVVVSIVIIVGLRRFVKPYFQISLSFS